MCVIELLLRGWKLADKVILGVEKEILMGEKLINDLKEYKEYVEKEKEEFGKDIKKEIEAGISSLIQFINHQHDPQEKKVLIKDWKITKISRKADSDLYVIGIDFIVYHYSIQKSKRFPVTIARILRQKKAIQQIEQLNIKYKVRFVFNPLLGHRLTFPAKVKA